jgi:hypothetical protein
MEITMYKFPPHLPPPVCNLSAHYIWSRLKFLCFVSFIGLIAGLSGASILAGWILPNITGDNSWYSINANNSNGVRLQLSDQVYNEISSRVLTIYSKIYDTEDTQYLDKTNIIGEAIILSTDGWVVLYQPDFKGSYKNFIALSKDGKTYQAESAIFDKYSGMLYIKIKGAQFKVISFIDFIAIPDKFFVLQNGYWKNTALNNKTIAPFLNSHLDTAPIAVFALDDQFNAGAIVTNSQGKIAGFITKDNQLLPSEYITRTMSEILSSNNLIYYSLGIDGWYSEEKPIILKKQQIIGFQVAKVWSVNSSLLTGDIITKINGRDFIVENSNLWYDLNNSQPIKLTVFRNGKTIEIAGKKELITISNN